MESDEDDECSANTSIEDNECSANTSIAETDTLQTEQKGMHTLKHTCEHNLFYLY